MDQRRSRQTQAAGFRKIRGVKEKKTVSRILPAEHAREIAAVPRSTWWSAPGDWRVSSHVARSEGFSEAMASSWSMGTYALFEQMEEKDAHLFSILQTRKNGVLARPTKVEPATSSQTDQEIAQWVQSVLETLPNWDGALLHLLDGLAKGMAVLEVIWGYDAQGRIVPTNLKPRGAWRFSFGPDGALYLNDSAFGGISSVERTGGNGDGNRSTRELRPVNSSSINNLQSAIGRRLPDRKFMVLLFNADDERPYGRGLLERVYWYWWFKKNNLKFWIMYNEKFGAPTVVAKHGPGLAQTERDRLLQVISSLQADAGVTVPEGITLELLESNRRGSAETYRDLANWCNDEMSRAVLGQTLTVSEGNRSGSFALARVHDAVRFDYIRADACQLMNAVNSQLVRWMVDFNFGEKISSPRWTVDLTPDLDTEVEANIDRQLIQIGVPLPLRYFYEKYRRPAAVPGERQLRYDDSNLYQYHLQFGVLTVNEVRASLGLPPVAWGDKPTSPAALNSTQPAPKGAAGDGPTDEQQTEIKQELKKEK